MTNEHVDDLIDLYALGALEPGEQQAVDEHIETCTRCRAQLAEAKRLVLLLAWTPDQHDPPPALQQKLMQRITGLQRREGRVPQKWWQNIDLQHWFVIPRPVLGLATVAALALALVLGGRAIQLQRQLATAQAQLSAQQQQLTDVQAQLAGKQQELATLQAQTQELQPVINVLRQPGARLVTITAQDNPTQVQGYLLLRPDTREAFVTTASLAPLPQGQTYQFWLISGDQLESGGIFGLNQQGVGTLKIEAQRPLGQYQAIGISVEPAGGSAQPTQVVLINNL